MLTLESIFGDEAHILHQRDLQLLLMATVFPVLGTALVSPMLDSLIRPYGATSTNIGLMISVFTAPGVVIIPVAGVLADRYSRKAVLVTSLLLFGLTGLALALTTDFRVVLALRFFQGMGYAGINPIIITSIGDLYRGDEEATGQGIRFMLAGFSGALFPLLAGLLVVVAWQYPFLLYALAVPVALAIYRWFDEPAELSHDEGQGAPRSYLRSLLSLSVRRRVLGWMLARALFIVVWYGFLTYNSLIVVTLLGGTPVQAGLLTAIGFVTIAVGASQAGRMTAGFESPLHPVVGANLCLAAGFAIVLFAPGMIVATLGIGISGLGFGLLGALYRSIITGLAPIHLRAGVTSLSEAGGRVTATLTPLLMGAGIGFAAPAVGLGPALQYSGLAMAILGGGGGIVSVLLASSAPPTPAEGDSAVSNDV